MPPWELIDHVSRLGFVGGLIVALYLLSTGKVRWGRDFDELKGERDQWKRAALRGSELSRRAVRLADKAGSKKAGAAHDGTEDEEPGD